MSEQTHWKKLTNPNFLGSYSLDPGKDKIVTITKVVKEQVTNGDGKKQDAIVAYLNGEKPMILNKTNCKIISKIYDCPYIEDWAGKQIILFSTKVKAFGEEVEALRIRPNKPNNKKQELTPKHEKWAGAVKALKEGNVTIESIKKTYELSEQNQQKLIDEAI